MGKTARLAAVLQPSALLRPWREDPNCRNACCHAWRVLLPRLARLLPRLARIVATTGAYCGVSTVITSATIVPVQRPGLHDLQLCLQARCLPRCRSWRGSQPPKRLLPRLARIVATTGAFIATPGAYCCHDWRVLWRLDGDHVSRNRPGAAPWLRGRRVQRVAAASRAAGSRGDGRGLPLRATRLHLSRSSRRAY